jgi:uncharacterized protein
MGKISFADVASALSDEALHLVLMPTEQCNFRCIYCFESFRHGAMPVPVVNAVENLLTSRFDGLTYLVVSWYGGEPLLAMNVIASVSERIRSLLKSRPVVRYKGSMTTNGYLLTPEVFRKLLDWRILTYQISFDGPKEHHDRKRIRADGGPTFDRLWGNLIKMRAFPDSFAVTVRLHVDRDNFRQAPEFLEQFARDFGDDSRFAVYIIKLGQYSNSPSQNLNLLPPGDSDGIMKEIREFAGAMKIPVRVADRDDHESSSMCFAAKLNSFVIRSNGEISKCIVALDQDANHVGKVNEDGTLNLDRMKLLKWARGLSSGEKQELECPLRDIDLRIAARTSCARARPEP